MWSVWSDQVGGVCTRVPRVRRFPESNIPTDSDAGELCFATPAKIERLLS